MGGFTKDTTNNRSRWGWNEYGDYRNDLVCSVSVTVLGLLLGQLLHYAPPE